MFLASLSIKRPIMISMGLLAMVVFGILAFFGLTLNLMPDVEFPFVTIQIIYPGAGPQEIETQITKKIEDAVSTISKIDFIRSYSMEGVSYVIIRFEIGKDPDIANQEAKDKVNAILNELPADTELPVVQKFDASSFPIIDIVLTGELSMKELYELADKKLKDRLSQIEGVGKVTQVGGEEREIVVELDDRVVIQNAVSLQTLSQLLAVHNMDIPGGHFKQRSQEYSVRLSGEYSDVETIKELEIPTAYGIKKLGQIANVSDGSAEVRERSTYFNNIDKIREDHVILLSVIKSPDGNTVDMANDIKETLPLLEQELPAGCRLSIVQDASIFIQSSVQDTLGNIILGVLLTGLVLLFFLHDLRSTLIVATAMPFSIVSTFMLLQLSGFSLNIMTLMGLSTAVGILVTNSVVVLENIFRHKEMGHSRVEAAGGYCFDHDQYCRLSADCHDGQPGGAVLQRICADGYLCHRFFDHCLFYGYTDAGFIDFTGCRHKKTSPG
jgi:HAE1 family hydrophobic/amphiphilic exporter-1